MEKVKFWAEASQIEALMLSYGLIDVVNGELHDNVFLDDSVRKRCRPKDNLSKISSKYFQMTNRQWTERMHGHEMVANYNKANLLYYFRNGYDDEPDV